MKDEVQRSVSIGPTSHKYGFTESRKANLVEALVDADQQQVIVKCDIHLLLYDVDCSLGDLRYAAR